MKKLETKKLLRNEKFQQLFTKKDFYFIFFLRFWIANSQEFRSTTSYLSSKCTAKNYEIKDFSLANDAETHSLTKEENEKRFFFI
jgi:hypothetical protein